MSIKDGQESPISYRERIEAENKELKDRVEGQTAVIRHLGDSINLLLNPTELNFVELSQLLLRKVSNIVCDMGIYIEDLNVQIETENNKKDSSHKVKIEPGIFYITLVDDLSGDENVVTITTEDFIKAFPKKEFIISQAEIHRVAKEHGWWPDYSKNVIPEKLALIHAEVSEALEAYRNNKLREKDGKGWFGEELADIYIRLADLAEAYKINLAAEVEKKHEFNKTRPFRHGNKKC